MVMDDDFYDAWDFYPGQPRLHAARARPAHRGARLPVGQPAGPQRDLLALRHHQRGHDRLRRQHHLRPLHGLGRGRLGPLLRRHLRVRRRQRLLRPRRSTRDVINLVYTWDNCGHGRDLTSSCGRTGYLGYAYLETPGNPTDGIDNDEDGITDERRDGGPGVLIVGQDAILAYVPANYDLARFEADLRPARGPPGLPRRAAGGPATRTWTGRPSSTTWAPTAWPRPATPARATASPPTGEPNFDRTDLNESDQIGLTGFKINRIRAGPGQSRTRTIDDILFFTDNHELAASGSTSSSPIRIRTAASTSRWPPTTTSASSSPRVRSQLAAGQTERFSLALAYGADLDELRAQRPDGAADLQRQLPVRRAAAAAHGDRRGRRRLRAAVLGRRRRARRRSGDRRVRLRGLPHLPLHRSGVPRSPGDHHRHRHRAPRQRPAHRPVRPRRRRAAASPSRRSRAWPTTWATDTGITHTWTDYSVTNGQQYYYAVTAYDFGSDEPSTSTPRRTPSPSRARRAAAWSCRPTWSRCGPNPARARATCRRRAEAARPGRAAAARAPWRVEVVNSDIGAGRSRLQDHLRHARSPDSLRATSLRADRQHHRRAPLRDRQRLRRRRASGRWARACCRSSDTGAAVAVDTAGTGFVPGSATDARLHGRPTSTVLPDQPRAAGLSRRHHDRLLRRRGRHVAGRRPFYPGHAGEVRGHRPHRRRATSASTSVFRDRDGDGTLSRADEFVDVVTYIAGEPGVPKSTWRFQLDRRRAVADARRRPRATPSTWS